MSESERREADAEVPREEPREAAVGEFVPYGAQNQGKQSARVGYIIAANGCHIWQGCRNRYGYGTVYADLKVKKAHRVRYEREIGPIPDGMVLDHFACDGGRDGCCNPHHCRPVTRRENTLRGNTLAAACAAKTHCVNGHALTPDNLEAFTMRKKGSRKCKKCAVDASRRYKERKKAA